MSFSAKLACPAFQSCPISECGWPLTFINDPNAVNFVVICPQCRFNIEVPRVGVPLRLSRLHCPQCSSPDLAVTNTPDNGWKYSCSDCFWDYEFESGVTRVAVKPGEKSPKIQRGGLDASAVAAKVKRRRRKEAGKLIEMQIENLADSREWDWTPAKIATACGCSRRWVEKCIKDKPEIAKLWEDYQRKAVGQATKLPSLDGWRKRQSAIDAEIDAKPPLRSRLRTKGAN
jgi:hypothetical protein